MSIDEVLDLANQGIVPVTPATPVSDKAAAIFSSSLPFRQRWDAIVALEPELNSASADDRYRFGWLIEGMYASAESPDDLRYMHGA